MKLPAKLIAGLVFAVAALMPIAFFALRGKAEKENAFFSVLGPPPYSGYFPIDLPRGKYGPGFGPAMFSFSKAQDIKPNCVIRNLTLKPVSTLFETTHSRNNDDSAYAYMDTQKGRAYFMWGVLFINGKSYAFSDNDIEVDAYIVENCISNKNQKIWLYFDKRRNPSL